MLNPFNPCGTQKYSKPMVSNRLWPHVFFHLKHFSLARGPQPQRSPVRGSSKSCSSCAPIACRASRRNGCWTSRGSPKIQGMWGKSWELTQKKPMFFSKKNNIIIESLTEIVIDPIKMLVWVTKMGTWWPKSGRLVMVGCDWAAVSQARMVNSKLENLGHPLKIEILGDWDPRRYPGNQKL